MTADPGCNKFNFWVPPHFYTKGYSLHSKTVVFLKKMGNK